MSRLDPIVDGVRERLTDDSRSDASIIVGTMLAVYALYLLFGLGMGFNFNGQINALQRITFLTAVFAMAGLALNLQWGYTGLFNVGIAGFMAIGVYAMGIATAPVDPESASAVPGLGLPVPIGIGLGILAAAVAGLLISLPALRLKADYLAIVTLGFSEIIRLSFSSSTLTEFTVGGATMGTGGNSGLNLAGDPSKLVRTFYETGFGVAALDGISDGIIAAFASVGIERPVAVNLTYTVLVVGLLILVYFLIQRLGNSPFGRTLRAIREDEETTRALGKNTQLMKAKSFVIGCGLLGLAAIFWQGSRGLTTPDTYLIELTVFVWIVVIIGGTGSNTGTVLGAALFVSLLQEGPRFLRSVIQNTVDVPRAPASIGEAVGALGGGDPFPLVSYVFDQLAALQFVVLGFVLIVIVQQRPKGLMGHRKEPASTLDLTKPRPTSDSEGPGSEVPSDD
ncbi:branched-chain amino acid ABC transporter permease [Halovivax cerinus]|uniref:Branched-chain amino acid ABC transporter permease n=1 Tax=Halovivax cerinus TaxID=1487865 RepID=A0ABD5NPL8_9EURY|nr:branched-chain amino acid ABC transporter permease [Halovivax cerinus]